MRFQRTLASLAPLKRVPLGREGAVVICAVHRPGRAEGAGGSERGRPQGVGNKAGWSVSPYSTDITTRKE